MEVVIFFWLIFAGLVAVFAARRGRSGALAFFVSFLISPLLAFIVYAILGRSEKADRARIEREERMRADARDRIEAERARRG